MLGLDRALAGDDPARAPQGDRVLERGDHRGRLPVPRDLPDDAGADRDPPGPRRRARADHPGALLLGDRAALQRPRQRPDLPRLLRDGQGACPPRAARPWSPWSTGRSATTCSSPISLGAVFMGANTYIGNAPNLMVKLIAEQRRVKMPSFFGYMLYSGGVLIPLFALGLVALLPLSRRWPRLTAGRGRAKIRGDRAWRRRAPSGPR